MTHYIAHTIRTARAGDQCHWKVCEGEGMVAGGYAPDEPTARKCAQAVIDALSPQPTAPTDAEWVRLTTRKWESERFALRGTGYEVSTRRTTGVSTIYVYAVLFGDGFDSLLSAQEEAERDLATYQAVMTDAIADGGTS